MELILDASVVIKWFLEENLSQKAIEYRKQHLGKKITLVAPSLLNLEIINALCTKSGVSLKAVLSAIEVFYFTNIKEYPFVKLLAQKATRLSRKYQVSIYDASYIALAQKFNCQFITADKKLYQKIKSLKLVKLLQ